jgi:hypothetical protein
MKGQPQGKYRRVPAPYDLPRSAEDIDLDRLVWDPVYRRAVRPLIDAEDAGEKLAAPKTGRAGDGPPRGAGSKKTA